MIFESDVKYIFFHYNLWYIDAGGEGGISCTPTKDFEKFGHINTKNMKIENPLYFLTTPQFLLSKNFKSTVRRRS